MKPAIFTLAEFGQAYENGTRLTITGTFDVIWAERCPFTYQLFVVVGKFLGDRKDHGKTYNAVLRVRKRGSRKSILESPCELAFPEPPEGTTSSAQILVKILGATFGSYGTYLFEILNHGRVVAATALHIRPLSVEPSKPNKSTNREKSQRLAGKKGKKTKKPTRKKK